MGTMFKFGEGVRLALGGWAGSARTDHMDKLITESPHGAEQEMIVIDEITASITEHSSATQAPTSSIMPAS